LLIFNFRDFLAGFSSDWIPFLCQFCIPVTRSGRNFSHFKRGKGGGHDYRVTGRELLTFLTACDIALHVSEVLEVFALCRTSHHHYDYVILLLMFF